jgi:ABC-type multidrug transport system ATPase subunit
MRRRLEIARGLLHHPSIFFLDEPTIGLDPQTRNQMWNYVQNLNTTEKITIFFTTHYMEEARKTTESSTRRTDDYHLSSYIRDSSFKVIYYAV